MQENYHSGPSNWLNIFSKLLSLFGFFLLGSFIGQFIGMGCVMVQTNLIVEIKSANQLILTQKILSFMSNPAAFYNGQKAMMGFQWFSSLFSFVFTAWAYNRFINKQTLEDLSPNQIPSWQIVFWAIFALIVSIPLMEYIIQWNQHIQLPTQYSEIEKTMKNSEEMVGKLTKFLIHFERPIDFIAGLFVIAALAGLGEELFFRGILQNLFEKYLNNKHVAIWASAAIFSFIHFQFYGYFPRLLWGAFFGYLYVWYRNLWIPIMAHFFNNGFTLTMSYMYQLKKIHINPQETAEYIPIWSAAISLLIVTYYIYRLYKHKTS
jgi:membrane protease YdiL (CAAX protease family)